MQDITWEKYIEIGKAVKEKTGKAMLTMDPSDLNQIRVMMQSAGAWYVDKDGKVIYTELVPEITQEPDYDSAIAVLK